jgi:hypothetical protein
MSQENDAVANKQDKAPSIPLLFDDHEASSEIAAQLIPPYHPHLAEAKIKYLCRNNAAKSGGEKIQGTIKKASPMERHLCGDDYDYIMVISLDVWNTLNAKQRTALVDHLLMRCTATEDQKNGEMKYSIRPPMVQEFPEIALRHGKWNEGLAELGAFLNK